MLSWLCSLFEPVLMSNPLMPTDNYIDGAEFAALSTEDIKAMVPPIGLANKISRLRPQVYYYKISFQPSHFIKMLRVFKFTSSVQWHF